VDDTRCKVELRDLIKLHSQVRYIIYKIEKSPFFPYAIETGAQSEWALMQRKLKTTANMLQYLADPETEFKR